MSALVLWDDPVLAGHAVAVCKNIENRSEEVKFRIETAATADLEGNGEAIQAKACNADVVLVALQRSLGDLPESVRAWFQEWARARKRHAGALAVVRPPDPVDAGQLSQLLHEPQERFVPCSEQDQEFREFLEDCANRARMELFWGCVESGLGDATLGMRVLEAPACAAA